MKRIANCRNALKFIFVLCSLFTWTTACNFDSDCSSFFDEKCCHGTCIDNDATCISGGAIAGIVIGCLIIGGTVISCCLCFCCACGPFQNRSQGTVIRYGGAGARTQTTTTGTSYPTSNVQAGYGTSYPQPAPVNYPNTVQSQGKYPQSGPVPYPSAVQGQAPYVGPLAGGAVYPPPSSAPPSYDEASVPPPYNPVYPS